VVLTAAGAQAEDLLVTGGVDPKSHNDRHSADMDAVEHHCYVVVRDLSVKELLGLLLYFLGEVPADVALADALALVSISLNPLVPAGRDAMHDVLEDLFPELVGVLE